MRDLQRMLNDMFLGAEVARRTALVAKAKADPVANKATLQWADGIEPRWRYFDGGVDRRGVRRRFCWTTTRNAAGYFLSFVETFDTKRGRGERKYIVASKRRETCKERARARWKAWSNRNRLAKAD